MKQKLLLTLVLFMMAVTGAMATEYISDLMLIGSGTSAGAKKQEYVNQGWKDTNYNLNKGCGSSATNIYLLYKTSTNKDDAITGFYIQCGSSTRSETQVKDGRTYLPVQGEYDDNFIKNKCNLNNNAGGNKIYLFYTKEPFDDGRAVTDIWFDNAKSGGVGSNGNDNSPCDLNSGANGSFIYMHAYYGDRHNSVEYEDHKWDAKNRKVITTTKTCDNFTWLTSNNNEGKYEVLKDGWYVLDYDIDYKEYLDIDGDVKIILMNGKTMNAHNGIRIKTDKKLTIYGQSGNKGKIKADGSIGGKDDIYAGELIIHGGNIDCKSASHNNAAIGSGNGSRNSKAGFKAITIYGGDITAIGEPGAAGIGAGQECNDDYQGPITIYNGTVNATGGKNGAGIGGGEESGNGPIYIYGGSVTATGGELGAGIGAGEDSHLCNDIYILGGNVKASGGEKADGIGAGYWRSGWADDQHKKQYKDLYVENADLVATGGDITGGGEPGFSVNIGNLVINNSHVKFNTYNDHLAVQLTGDVTLGDNLSVICDGSTQTKDNRGQGMKEAETVEVTKCDRHNRTATDNGDGTHHRDCKYCMGVDEPHNYTNNNGVYTCICGLSKDFTTQAVWCAGNHTLYFVNAQENYQAGGEYDGQTITSVTSGNDVTNTGTTQRPSWGLMTRADLQRVVFDESFAMVTPQKLYSWFADCWALTTIEGIEHLNTSACTTMKGLFDNCKGLATIDVSGFDMSSVTNTERMFANCENLKTILCDNTWSDIEISSQMFTGCTNLKGAMGTVSYNAINANDITFANPETGYFTNTGTVIAQALWCDGNKTLYFVRPEAPVKTGDKYNGQTVTSVWSGGNVLATGDTAPGWNTIKAEATTVVFDASFAIAKPTSLVSWFSDFTSLTSADLNGLDVSEVQSAASMFSGCTNLQTLYCDNTWTIANTEGMFAGCTNLKGAVGYDAANDNGIMANPTSGYFAKKWAVELPNDGISVSSLTPYTNETVTISGEGDSGEGLTAVTVTGQRTDADITVTDNGDGTWSFIMPAEDVTVKEEINIAIYDDQDNSELLKQYKGKTVNVTYDRILKATDNGDGTWSSKAYTVCLPYEVDLRDEFDKGLVRLYELVFVNDNYEFVFNGATPIKIKAGMPYLVVVDSAFISLNGKNVVTQAIPEQDEDDGVVYPDFESWQNRENGVGWWRGTYSPIENEEATQQHLFALSSDGKWNSFNNDTEAHRSTRIPTFRAYYLPKTFTDYRDYTTKFTLLEGGGDPDDSWLRLPDSYEGDVENGGATAIQPTIHTIDADGTHTYYDLQGRKLQGKPTRKGVYIYNGKTIKQ